MLINYKLFFDSVYIAKLPLDIRERYIDPYSSTELLLDINGCTISLENGLKYFTGCCDFYVYMLEHNTVVRMEWLITRDVESTTAYKNKASYYV